MSAAMKWILAIVGLLVANMLAMGALIVAARSSSAGVIPDYYDKAVRYDETIDQAARNRALGWTVRVEVVAAALDVRVRDASGAPIEGASVAVTGYARATAARVALELVDGGGGSYRAKLARPVGWHDLVVTVDLGGARFVESVSIDLGALR